LHKPFQIIPYRMVICLPVAFILLLAACSAAPAAPAPTATLYFPSALPQPTQTASPQPDATLTPAPTALPNEKALLDALDHSGQFGAVWADYVTPGSFTAPEVEERLALVGGVPDGDGVSVNWLIARREKDQWKVVWVSKPVGHGWSTSSPAISTEPIPLAPRLSDYDHDGQNEVFFTSQQIKDGWTWETVMLHAWNGSALASTGLSLLTLEDNTLVMEDKYSARYRHVFQSHYGWNDQDGDGVDELQVNELVTLYGMDPAGLQANLDDVLFQKYQMLVYRWDGDSFDLQSSAANSLKRLPYQITGMPVTETPLPTSTLPVTITPAP